MSLIDPLEQWFSSKECSVWNTTNIIALSLLKKCSAWLRQVYFLQLVAGSQVKNFRATCTVHSNHLVRDAAVELKKVILQCRNDNAQDGDLFMPYHFSFSCIFRPESLTIIDTFVAVLYCYVF